MEPPPPPPAAATGTTAAPAPWWHLDNDNQEISPCAQHVLVTSVMVLFFFVSAYDLWSAADGGFTMNAIVFVYCTAMINLELLRQRSQISKLLLHQVMLVASGLMIISSVTAVVVFHPRCCRELSNIAIFAFLSAALVLLLVKLDHMGRQDDEIKSPASSLV